MRLDAHSMMPAARCPEPVERVARPALLPPAPAGFGERFLRLPDMFPARQSGECWGEERIVVRFAGSDYVCEGLSATQAVAVRERFGALCPASSPDGHPAVTLRVFRAFADEFVADEREWEFDFDLDYAPGVVRFAGFHFLGRLDGTAQLRAALWTPEDGRLVSHAIFENVLRVVAAYHLLEQGGVLLHSAAVADDARRPRLLRSVGGRQVDDLPPRDATRRAVLSDDMNALRVTAGGVTVEKLPFAGDFGQTQETADGRLSRALPLPPEKGATPALRAMRSRIRRRGAARVRAVRQPESLPIRRAGRDAAGA